MTPHPSMAEVLKSLYGAGRLLRFDAGGVQYFDVSERAFWQSFYAAVYTLPAYVVLVLVSLAEAGYTAGPLRIFLVEAIAYVISWTAFPLVAWQLVQVMDRQEHYIRYIVAFNWSQVIIAAIFLPMVLISELGLLGGAGDFATFLVWIGLLIYIWYVAKSALEVTGGAASGFVILDIFLSFLVKGAVDIMLR